MYDRTRHYFEEMEELYMDKIYIFSSYTKQKHSIYTAKKYGTIHNIQIPLQQYIENKYEADCIVFPNRTIFQQCRSWNPNLAKIFAKKYAQRTQIPVCSDIKKKLSLKTQKTSSKKQRQINIQESFVYSANNLRKTLQNKDILLIDDIISSGNTANEIAKICKNHGAKTVTGYFFSSPSV